MKIKSIARFWLALVTLATGISYAHADHSPKFPLPFVFDDKNPLNTLTINGLTIDTVQGYPTFKSGIDDNAYSKGDIKNGIKNAIFIGMKLWEGASVYVNPEMMQGYNVSNDVSLVNSANVAMPRVESSNPYLQLQRLFVRQVINLDGTKTESSNNVGGRSQALEDLVNKLDDKVSDHNLTLTFGKFGVGDVFDDNIYAHDPTRHFMNMTFVGMNSVDWIGNAWGTTVGASAEWQKDWWTLRAGIFQGSLPPPSNNIDPWPLRQYMMIAEAEARYNIFKQPGNIKLIGYQDHGYINNLGEYYGTASYFDYLPYFAKNQLQRRTKLGVAVNLQQQLTDGIGLFMRAGMDNKAFDYFDSTHSINGGIVANGKLWNRPLDEFGIAFGFDSLQGANAVVDKVLKPIGTGTLNFTPEKTFETYYRIGVTDHLELTIDYQTLINPNFIKQSTPAHVFGLRLRANF